MAIPRSRLEDLMRVQCRIFDTIFNPKGLRLGNKILRQRLKGPSIASYYPPRIATFKKLQKLYPGFDTYNDFEEERLEHVSRLKARGKGVPKKKNGPNDKLAKGKKK